MLLELLCSDSALQVALVSDGLNGSSLRECERSSVLNALAVVRILAVGGVVDGSAILGGDGHCCRFSEWGLTTDGRSSERWRYSTADGNLNLCGTYLSAACCELEGCIVALPCTFLTVFLISVGSGSSIGEVSGTLLCSTFRSASEYHLCDVACRRRNLGEATLTETVLLAATESTLVANNDNSLLAESVVLLFTA